MFNWHMLVYYFIIFTIKRGKYIIRVIITICYYQLPINLIKILRKRIPIRICEVAHFSFSGLILSLADLNIQNCEKWSLTSEIMLPLTDTQSGLFSNILTIREAELPQSRDEIISELARHQSYHG